MTNWIEAALFVFVAVLADFLLLFSRSGWNPDRMNKYDALH
jgi:hypothetical protein